MRGRDSALPCSRPIAQADGAPSATTAQAPTRRQFLAEEELADEGGEDDAGFADGGRKAAAHFSLDLPLAQDAATAVIDHPAVEARDAEFDIVADRGEALAFLD